MLTGRREDRVCPPRRRLQSGGTLPDSGLGRQHRALGAVGQNPAWSPDGSKLAFILRKQGEPDALATSAADGSDTLIIFKSDDVYPFFGRLSWSLDGNVLAVSPSRGAMSLENWSVPPRGAATAQLPQ